MIYTLAVKFGIIKERLSYEEIVMGGTALREKGHESIRMDLPTYLRIESEVCDILNRHGIKHFTIPYVKDKTSFGDIDILFVNNETQIEYIMKNYSDMFNIDHTRIRKDSGSEVISVLYKGHQIDLIATKPEYSDYHLNYLSNNDFGNILGRSLKECGYKHGHDGLYYTYREGNTYKKDILISYNYEDALRLMGLNPEKYKSGFENLEDMFDYICKSIYFKPSRYKIENLNNRNRVRDRKRKTYNMFLNYVKDMQDSNIKLPSPFDVYPWLIDSVQQIRNDRKFASTSARLFNGNVVRSITGLELEELGKFMKEFKLKHSHMFKDISDADTMNKLISSYYHDVFKHSS